MLKLISYTGLVLSLSLGALGGSAATASAQDVQLRIGPDGVRPVIRDRDRDRDRNFGRGRGCSRDEARAAARDEGLRRPEVIRITDRSVTVEGLSRNGPSRITFANSRGCPLI